MKKIVLNNQVISKLPHFISGDAKIIKKDECFLAINLKKRNHFILNDVKGNSFPLKSGDVLKINNRKYSIKIENLVSNTSSCLIEKLAHEIYRILLSLLDKSDDNTAVSELMDQAINRFFSSHKADEHQKRAVIERLKNELFSFGPLNNLLKDPSINEIMVNKEDNIYIEKDGRIIKTDLVFFSVQNYQNAIERIISLSGGRLDENLPFIDTRFKNGSRINIIVPPVSIGGPCITIRKFNNHKFNFNGLVEQGFIPIKIKKFLEELIKKEKNVIISGNTGSGKTTLLNALSEFIDDTHRVITIEDTAELDIKKDHLITLQSRRVNVEGEGSISARDLLKNSLRMRPDRIIVGECRGEETLDMLQAMSTGHKGSLSTIHANSAPDALKRIESLIMLTNNLNPLGLREQIACSIDFIIHTQRVPGGSRHLSEIIEINGIDDSTIIYSSIYKNGEYRPEISKLKKYL